MVDKSGLTCDQGKQVKALVKEEKLVLSVDGDDIGDVTSTKWRFNSLTRHQYNKTIILSQERCTTN